MKQQTGSKEDKNERSDANGWNYSLILGGGECKRGEQRKEAQRGRQKGLAERKLKGAGKN